MPVAPGDRVHVFFESSRADPVQGLSIACGNRRHTIGVAGQERNGFTLWTDTAPRHVEVDVLAKRAAGEIVLMNVWGLPGYDHVAMRGINAACMAVTEVRAGEWLLECNDGYGVEPPSFTDLVVRLIVESAAGGKAAI